MARLLVVNGPNLNLLSKRETSHYGVLSLNAINDQLTALASHHGHELIHFQSNAEHALIDRIHEAADENIAFIIINPAAFTHTSIALRDALLAVEIPFIEVHLSNVYAREPFRKHSYFSDIAAGVILGLGADSYRLALDHVINQLKSEKK